MSEIGRASIFRIIAEKLEYIRCSANRGTIIFAILFFLLAFPKIEPEVSTGLDASYKFAYNYFFSNGVQSGVDVLFTYGPLGFLKSPMVIENNLILGIIYTSVLFFLFILHLIILAYKMRGSRHSLLFLFAILIAVSYLGFDLWFYGIMLSGLLLHFKTRNKIFLIAPVLSATFAVLIKANIGILCIAIYYSYIAFFYIKFRKTKRLLFHVVLPVITISLLWISIYGNLNGIINYFYGLVLFSAGNSNVMSVNPVNNIYLLLMSLGCYFLLPIANRKTETWLLYFISAAAMFAMFKYAFAREENYHIKAMFDFIVLFAFILILSGNIKSLGHKVILFLVPIFFWYNMTHLSTFTIKMQSPEIVTTNFIDQVIKYSDFEKEYKIKSVQNTDSKKIPQDVLSVIGKSPIDFYPWELSYVFTENLSYKPRPVIQAGAYHKWLDLKNAEFLRSEHSSKYILWEKTGNTDFDGFDERYLLNSDGNYVYEVFNNYEFELKTENLTLLKRSKEQQLSKPAIKETGKLKFGEWLSINTDKNNFVRLYGKVTKSLSGKLKTMFFKDCLYFIEYVKENGDTIKHRITPDNFTTGIWLSPYLSILSKEMQGEKTLKARFTTSDESFINKEVQYWIESFSYKSEIASINSKYDIDTILINDFEKYYSWWPHDTNRCSKQSSGSEKKCFNFTEELEFGPTLQMPISSLGKINNCFIEISAISRSADKTDAILVFNIIRNKKDIVWKGYNLNSIDESQKGKWQTANSGRIFLSGYKPDDILNIYIWNHKKQTFQIDDLKVSLYKIK